VGDSNSPAAGVDPALPDGELRKKPLDSFDTGFYRVNRDRPHHESRAAERIAGYIANQVAAVRARKEWTCSQ